MPSPVAAGGDACGRGCEAAGGGSADETALAGGEDCLHAVARMQQLQVVGDALSDYDVGWVDSALDGPDAARTALQSLHRLTDLRPRVLLPAHGPIPADTDGALASARRRGQRHVDDPDGAVRYGARRIFVFALMIRGGIPADEVEPYLHARAWLTNAARLCLTPEALAAELVETMIRGGAVVARNNRLHAAAEHIPVTPGTLQVPFPRKWSASRARAVPDRT